MASRVYRPCFSAFLLPCGAPDPGAPSGPVRHQEALERRQPHGRRALELAGIEFIDENGGGPGVRLRNRQRPKQSKIGALSAAMATSRP
jgi:hypothetical protein